MTVSVMTDQSAQSATLSKRHKVDTLPTGLPVPNVTIGTSRISAADPGHPQ